MKWKATDDQLNLFVEGIDSLRKKIFEPDTDGDWPVEFSIVDRTKYERTHYFPLPYDHKVGSIAELMDLMRYAMINVKMATDRMDQLMRSFEYNVEDILRKNNNLSENVDRIGDIDFSKLDDAGRTVLAQEVKIADLLAQNKALREERSQKYSEARDSFVTYLRDALTGIVPEESLSKMTAVNLIYELVERSGLEENAKTQSLLRREAQKRG